jgi:hypothetical protein
MYALRYFVNGHFGYLENLSDGRGARTRIKMEARKDSHLIRVSSMIVCGAMVIQAPTVMVIAR